MADTTPRLTLPFLSAAAAQKHVQHNEALALLDVAAQMTVKNRTLTTPPSSPAEGDAHLISTGANGLWAWRDGQLAIWTSGGWRFIAPRDGWIVFIEAEQIFIARRGGAWVTATVVAHSHVPAEVTGLDTALAGKVAKAGDSITGRLDVAQKLIVGDTAATDGEGVVARHATAAAMSAHVNSGGEALLGLREAGTRRAALRWQAGTLKLQTDGAAPLVLATQGSDRVAVPADRPAIGIGTNAPAQALHVSTSTLPKLRLQLTGGSARSWDIGQTTDGHLEMMDVEVGVAMLRLRSVTDTEGAEVAMIGGHGGVSASFFNVAGTGGSAAGCAMSLRANSVTGRSLNASGTINASGADFAEYVTKAPGCGPVAKGAVVGIDDQGRITDRFADAIAFAVKSTAPALVGGDAWGGDDEARPMVDRIAFAGRVPLTLTGAVIPGRIAIAEADAAGSIRARCLAAGERLDDAHDARILGRIWRLLGDGTGELAVRVG
ncbi:DUF2793 domain-containing protein [Tistrella sp. BH-R2-4]|uniref:DUF2793 domain-containing protein n=1 Tax=Tistrella arctica TaxID=3133430 RepID=A0ABU9YD57_9PROT